MGNVYADLKQGLEEAIEIWENRTPNKITEEKEYPDHTDNLIQHSSHHDTQMNQYPR